MNRPRQTLARRLAAVGFAVFAAIRAIAAPDSPPLADAGSIPLPDVEGRLDHLAVDVAGRRLFVAALENRTIEVVDLAKRRRVRQLAGIREPQGLLYIPGVERLLACCRGDGTCRSLDGRTFAEGPWIDLGRNADNLRFDPSSRTVYVGHGGEPGPGAITAIDLASLLPVEAGGRAAPPHSPADFLLDRPRQADPRAELALPSHPESFQHDPLRHRLYINVPDEHRVQVVDATGGTPAPIAAWPVTSGEKNFPMALDAASGRLYVACRKPARLAVYDVGNGSLQSETPCVGDADDVFHDAALRRIYIVGGEGFVEVHDVSGGGPPVRIARLPTRPRARTGLFVPELGLLAVALPHTTNGPAALRLYRTQRP